MSHTKLLILVTSIIVISLAIAVILINVFTSNGGSEPEEPLPKTKIILLGGSQSGKTIEVFYPNESSWNSLQGTQLPQALKGPTAQVFNNRIILAGGETKTRSYINSTLFIDLTSWIITPGPGLLEGRGFAASALIGDIMIVCGGVNAKKTRVSTCETLNLNENEEAIWETMAGMSYSRSHFSMVSVHSSLYVMGGWSGGFSAIQIVERYDTDTKVWTLLPILKYPRAGAGAAVVDENVIICGGNNGLTVLDMKTCEMYDVNTNQWSDMKKMRNGRYGFSMVEFNCDLIVFGDDSPNVEKVVDIYDYESKKWKKHSENLIKGRSFSAVVVL